VESFQRARPDFGVGRGTEIGSVIGEEDVLGHETVPFLVDVGDAQTRSERAGVEAPAWRGAVATPRMTGRTNDGDFGSSWRSRRVTANPTCWIEVSVGRLQSQCTTNRLTGFMRSW